MIFKYLWMKIQLWWMVECKCPINEKFHRVQIMYQPNTAYHWNEKGDDPNSPMICCEDMAEECVKYWQAMWEELYTIW